MAAAQRWSRLGGRFPGRSGRGRALRGQQRRCGDRRAAAHHFERADRVRVDAGRGGGSGTRRRGASFAILAQPYPGNTHSRHAQARRHYGFGLPRARHASFGPQPVAFGGACGCILCFGGPWIAMGDWNMEPKDLVQGGWLETVSGKVAATSAATCAGGAGAVLDCFVLSEAMAHLVQQIKVVDNSPTTPHSPVSLTLTATS